MQYLTISKTYSSKSGFFGLTLVEPDAIERFDALVASDEILQKQVEEIRATSQNLGLCLSNMLPSHRNG
jgi:hypothetical protein